MPLMVVVAFFARRRSAVGVVTVAARVRVVLSPRSIPGGSCVSVVAVTVILWGVVGVRVCAPVFAVAVTGRVGAVDRALMHLGQPLLQQGVVDGSFCKSVGPVLGEGLDDGRAVGIDIAFMVLYRSNGAGRARVQTFELGEYVLFVLKVDWVGGCQCRLL